VTRSLAAACLMVASASCYDPDVKVGVPCSPEGDCPSGQQCDVASKICMPPTDMSTWREDTAADFEQAGARLTDAIVEPAGFVAPTPYVTGRVKLRAIASDTVGDPTTTTWETASAGTVVGTAFHNRIDIDYGTAIPYGLGLPTGEGVTVLLEGEINLDATGAWRFSFNANDKGFIDIAPPGGDFARLGDDTDSNTTLDYTVTTTGWHRVRIAFTDNSQVMSIRLLADSPSVPGGFRSLDVDHLRARADELQGWLVEGFEEPYLLEYSSSTLLDQPIDVSIPADAFGMPIGTTAWSLRWSGQILIDVEGDYAWDIVSFHGHRLFIDGMELANSYTDAGTLTTTTSAVHLAPGWHDVVFDVTKSGTNTPGQASLTVATGPALVGQPIPIDHVRPLVPRSQRWTGAFSTAATPIPDGASASRTTTILPPVSFTPYSLAVGLGIDHPLREQVGVTLQPPPGGPITLFSPGDASGAGSYAASRMVASSLYGASWQFTASDNLVDGVTGSLIFTGVTITGSGGVSPFAASSRYESAVHELGDVVALGALTVTARQGSVAKVELRTCADAGACTSAPWIDVTGGDLSSVSPAPFAQYAVSLTSDGDVPTALDAFTLTYSSRN